MNDRELMVLLARAKRGTAGRCCDPSCSNHMGTQSGKPIAAFVFAEEYLQQHSNVGSLDKLDKIRATMFLVCKSCMNKGFMGEDTIFHGKIRKLSDEEWTVWTVMYS